MNSRIAATCAGVWTSSSVPSSARRRLPHVEAVPRPDRRRRCRDDRAQPVGPLRVARARRRGAETPRSTRDRSCGMSWLRWCWRRRLATAAGRAACVGRSRWPLSVGGGLRRLGWGAAVDRRLAAEHALQVVAVERLELDQRLGEAIEHVAVLGDDLRPPARSPRRSAGGSPRRSPRRSSRSSSSARRSRGRGRPALPCGRARPVPSRSLMPYSLTILRAMLVAFSMSFSAPVQISPKTTCSAACPPSAEAMHGFELAAWSCSSDPRAAASACSRPSCRAR